MAALLPAILRKIAKSPHKIMKFRTRLMCSTVMCSACSGLFLLPQQGQSWVAMSRHQSFVSLSLTSPSRSATSLRPTSLRSTLLRSTLAPEDEAVVSVSTSSETAPDDVIVAEGTVVSQFPGGLTAIRLNEDMASVSTSTGLPTIFSPERAALAATAGTAGSSSPLMSSNRASGDLQGREVIYLDGTRGCVVAYRPPVVFAFSDALPTSGPDGLVKITDRMATVQVSPSQSVIDCLDFSKSSYDDISNLDGVMERAVFAPISKVSDIALINNPMLTGTTMIDTLAPIGRGQNMLLIGENLTDMRGYVMDFMKTQLRDGKQTKCVYACNQADLIHVQSQLREFGLVQDVHVLAPSESDLRQRDDASKAAQSVLMAGAACAAGEVYAVEAGMNALVVVDTIDLHKKLWDATTRVLVDVYGVDAVVKGDLDGGASSEMRAFFSSLIQRAAQYKTSKGGGSVTLLLLVTLPPVDDNNDHVFDASLFERSPDKVKDRIKLLVQRKIPLTAANLRKIDIPVPTDGARRLALQHIDELISMSDGQIWLDERLAAKGQLPPMDPQRSLTRIGIGADTTSRADAPALRRIAERLRLDLSQASNMDGADQTTATKKQLQRKNALLVAMHQPSWAGGRRLSESCVALLAAQEGYLDEAASNDQCGLIMQALFDHVLREAAAAMAEVDETLDLNPSAREELSRAVESFFRHIKPT